MGSFPHNCRFPLEVSQYLLNGSCLQLSFLCMSLTIISFRLSALVDAMAHSDVASCEQGDESSRTQVITLLPATSIRRFPPLTHPTRYSYTPSEGSSDSLATSRLEHFDRLLDVEFTHPQHHNPLRTWLVSFKSVGSGRVRHGPDHDIQQEKAARHLVRSLYVRLVSY